MNLASWPTEVELGEFLQSQGLTPPSGMFLSLHLEAAIAEFEQLSGWSPYLKTDVEATRYYDAPEGIGQLDLRGAFQTITAVYTNLAGGSAGTLRTEGTDYDLWPYSGPYEEIRFGFVLGGGQKTISVTGIPGRVAEIPANVYLGIICGAAEKCIPQIEQGTSSIEKIKQGPVEMSYSSASGGSKREVFREKFLEAVALAPARISM